MAILRYSTKLKRGLGLAFDAHFLDKFTIKRCSLFTTLSMHKVSMIYLLSFSRYETKCVMEFLFTQLVTALILRFIFDLVLKQGLIERKRGEDTISRE